MVNLFLDGKLHIFSGITIYFLFFIFSWKVTAKQLKGGKESRMDVLVMENLLFRRSVTRLYDLKGSSRSRYNPDFKIVACVLGPLEGGV